MMTFLSARTRPLRLPVPYSSAHVAELFSWECEDGEGQSRLSGELEGKAK